MFGQPEIIVWTENGRRKLSEKKTFTRYLRAILPSQYLILLTSGNTCLTRANKFIPALSTSAQEHNHATGTNDHDEPKAIETETVRAVANDRPRNHHLSCRAPPEIDPAPRQTPHHQSLAPRYRRASTQNGTIQS